MEILIDDKKIELQKKERKVGTEAPAVRVKMLNGETNVIGMMADKVQVMLTLPKEDSLSDKLADIINKHSAKSIVYIISSKKLLKNIDESSSSIDFKDFSMKFGVYANEEYCAKSIFIIDKEGEFVYKEIVGDLDSEFDLEVFDKALEDAINFKRKGHVHENWMGA